MLHNIGDQNVESNSGSKNLDDKEEIEEGSVAGEFLLGFGWNFGTVQLQSLVGNKRLQPQLVGYKTTIGA